MSGNPFDTPKTSLSVAFLFPVSSSSPRRVACSFLASRRLSEPSSSSLGVVWCSFFGELLEKARRVLAFFFVRGVNDDDCAMMRRRSVDVSSKTRGGGGKNETTPEWRDFDGVEKVKKWSKIDTVDTMCEIIFWLFFRSRVLSSFFSFLPSFQNNSLVDEQKKKRKKRTTRKICLLLPSAHHHRKGDDDDDDASWVTNEHEAEVSDMAREICSRAGSAKTDRRTRRRI